ncbi:hypothetical protein [Nocardia carnea]|uniref:hypothetical protein n=1 Tax=Nocardia carnea TaxID=37328 RepID=UPI0024552F91|nr:hypothetical protein [Nocardia carnea]
MTPYPRERELLMSIGITPPPTIKLDEGSGFEDGRWRIEVPTVNSAEAAEALLVGAADRGLVINRITETEGMFCHTEEEIGRYVQLQDTYGVELLMSIGPRATYDIGASARTPEGARNANRLRGTAQLEYALSEVRRGLELGVRGFVVYDEGFLKALGDLRRAGHLPAEMHLKVSAHCGHGNPASMQLLAGLGANSINPIRDLPVAILAELRRAVPVPLDVHIDNPKSSGGFRRVMEAPEIVAAAAPVYLKTGNGVMDAHGTRPTPQQVNGMLRQVQLVTETMSRQAPEVKQSPATASTPARVA